MFTTIFGFTFLSPMMAKIKCSSNLQFSNILPQKPGPVTSCLLPVLFPQKFFDGQNSQPKRKAIIFLKDVDGFRLTNNTAALNVPTFL